MARPRKTSTATKAATKKEEKPLWDTFEEGQQVVFHATKDYLASTRIYRGYTTKMGEKRDGKLLTYKDGSLIEEPPTLRNTPARFLTDGAHKEIIKYMLEHPKCEGSPNAKPPFEFRLIDTERDRAEVLASEQRLTEAKSLVFSMTDDEVLELGTALRRNEKTVSAIREYALKLIEENVDAFMDMFDDDGNLDEYYKVAALYYKAISPRYKQITIKKDGSYFGDTKLGVGNEQSIKALLSTEYASVRQAIEDEIKTAMTS